MWFEVEVGDGGNGMTIAAGSEAAVVGDAVCIAVEVPLRLLGRIEGLCVLP